MTTKCHNAHLASAFLSQSLLSVQPAYLDFSLNYSSIHPARHVVAGCSVISAEELHVTHIKLLGQDDTVNTLRVLRAS